MSKHNWITIKSKLNGSTRTIAENEFNGMIDKADYEIAKYLGKKYIKIKK